MNAARPILINSWETAYFDFDGDRIVSLAEEAADLGIDMVVMDDGWFGKRNDDNSSLGDWYVNEEKLGCTLAELIQKIMQWASGSASGWNRRWSVKTVTCTGTIQTGF